MPSVVLLGPQRLRPTLVEAVEAAGVEGPIAAVTAGWEEREEEIEEMSAHLRRPVHDLRLHARGEEAFQEDPELFLAHGDRLDRLGRLQDLYRTRLAHALEAFREMLRAGGDPSVVDPEADAALEAVRALDAHHRARVAQCVAEHEASVRAEERPAVARHRREIAGIVSRCGALAIAGGHVGVLLDLMRLFDVGTLAAKVPVFAWSAGAMAVSELVVLFHDSPPHGPGNAEVFGDGLGLCRGILPLPHARRRLRLDDPSRVRVFARRFAPLVCAALDEGSRVAWSRRDGLAVAQARQLTPDGEVAEFRVA